MAAVNKIDSNITGLRYSEEASIGVLAGSPVWKALEPNSYDSFGGEISTVARNPINASRQRKKGVVTDLDASGGISQDLTQTNLQDILQGFFFADLRRKPEVGGDSEITGVADNVGTWEYSAAAGLDVFSVGSLIHASGFTNTENNGLKTATAASATAIGVSETLVAEASPPAAAKLVEVGFKFPAGDLDVDAAGDLPKLTAASTDLTTLGLIPGEFIYIGGDATGVKFSTPANNGWARVKSIAAGEIVLDKTQGTMVTEASDTETVQVFYGRVLKNESSSSLIKRRSYQLERTLGAPDDASPSQIQAEYLVGSVANELTLNFNQADKVTADLSFISTDHEFRTGAEGVKSGTRPALAEEDGFNTSSDFSRLKLSLLDGADANPDALFGFVTQFSVSINNNVSPSKAVGTLGAFDMTAGTFQVGGSMDAYFSTVAAVAAVRNNSDVTFDFALAQNNSGVAVDVPLISLGDGRLNVEQDQPITLPLATEASADRTFDHTLCMSWFDYLPDAAEA